MYSYAIGNPIRYNDPNGESAWDKVNGFANAVFSNNAFGAGRIPSNLYSGNRVDYQSGQSVGDVFSMIQAAVEIAGGSTLAGGGAILTVGSGGLAAAVSVPAVAGGAAAVTHDVTVAGLGAYNFSQGGKGDIKTPVGISDKIRGQLGARGWTTESIDEVIQKPNQTGTSVNRANGNDATAYFRKDGHYVVIDDTTNEVVQISDTNRKIGSGPGNWKVDRDIKVKK
jgi:hypothetical protein